MAGNRPQVLCGSHRFDPFGVWRDPVPKPVVMAVNGIAFTLSIELALAADIVIAADDVRFRQLEFGAAEALRIGLVQEAVPAGAHVQRAADLAHLIAQQAPLGVQATLASARAGLGRGPDAARDCIASLLPGIMRSQDAAEGLRSFTERREARFTGH